MASPALFSGSRWRLSFVARLRRCGHRRWSLHRSCRFVSDPRAGAFDLNWATNHPARLEDAAWRSRCTCWRKRPSRCSVAYYQKPIRASYFNGCSDGGREGMMEAQRFPADFNGILAGGAATYTTNGATEQLVVALNLKKAGITGFARSRDPSRWPRPLKSRPATAWTALSTGSSVTRPAAISTRTPWCASRARPPPTALPCAQADALAANLQARPRPGDRRLGFRRHVAGIRVQPDPLRVPPGWARSSRTPTIATR